MPRNGAIAYKKKILGQDARTVAFIIWMYPFASNAGI
jgi:hypothetical protein